MKLGSRIAFVAAGLTVAAVALCSYLTVRFAGENTANGLVQMGGQTYEHFQQEFSRKCAGSGAELPAAACRSFLIYMFRQCKGNEAFTLQHGQDMLANNSGVNPAIALEEYGRELPEENDLRYAIVQVGERHVLVMGQLGQEYLLALAQDVSREMDALARLGSQCAAVCGAVALAAALLMALLIRRALRPLSRLAQAAEQIAGGAYESRIAVHGRDEVAALSESFNHMARAVARHIGQVEATAQERGILLAALAHEMKTPVTAITGYAHALKHLELDKAQMQEAVSFIDSESRRLERLSGKLSQLIALHGEDLALQPVSCHALAGELRRALMPLAQGCGMALHISSSSGALEIEPDLLHSLVANLFDNARKAGAKNVTVLCSPREIAVTDDGPGIPEEELERVTQPFYTLDKSRTGESFGLGLALAARIAALHGAALSLENGENGGCVARVRFTTVLQSPDDMKTDGGIC